MVKWETKSDFQEERDETGFTADEQEDHAAGKLVAGYQYGGNYEGVNVNGLVGWWPLHEQSGRANDLSGTGNHGTVNGATQGASGIGGLTAYSFDGSDDKVDIGEQNTYNFSSTFSISAWVKSTDDNSAIVSNLGGGGGVKDGYAMLIGSPSGIKERSSGTLTFFARSPQSNNAFEVYSNATINDGNWHHCAIVVPSTDANDVVTYVDGAAGTTVSGLNQGQVDDYKTTNPSNPLMIGARANENTDWLNGTIENVRIYNRTLSASEVQTLYEWGSADLTSPPDDNDGGIAYFDCNSSTPDDAWSSKSVSTDNITHISNGGPRSDGAFEFGNNFESDSHYETSNGDIIGKNTDFCWSLWAYPTNFDGTAAVMMYHHPSDSNRSSIGHGTSTSGKVEASVYDGTAWVGKAVGSFTENEWHHITYNYDSDNSDGTLYINGVKQSGTAESKMGSSTSNGLMIGNEPSGSSFSGKIDEVRVYERQLNQHEIQQLYQYGTLGRDLRKFTVNAQ